ncbi:MAG: carboxypeptidase regulatory-like domain-containing protein [Gammaproteobacteria bacterium]|nr:carboxypeptidase regulatory-like domain-containing protein [Gammaproteobacteria bacterium]
MYRLFFARITASTASFVHCGPGVFMLLSAWLILVSTLGAQTQNASLTGVVLDASRAVVPDARVTVTHLPTNSSHETVTSSDGVFRLPVLPPGPYRLRAEHDGFAPTDVRDILLQVGDAVSLQVALAVASAEVSVTVVDHPDLIQTSPAVGLVVNRDLVDALPLNGRSFQSLITLTPGVVPTVSNANELGQFSVNGQRESSNYFTIDGVGANIGIQSGGSTAFGIAGEYPGFNALGGTNGLVTVDALQEFKIQTSSYAAEYGRSPGGQISIATRSGGNRFHGALFEYLRNEKLDANDWFANSRGLDREALRSNQFGGVLGGPIAENRTFFFVSYEGLRLRLPQAAVFQVPTSEARAQASGASASLLNAFPMPKGQDLGEGLAEFAAGWSNPSRSDSFGGRMDHSFSDSVQSFFRFHYASSERSVRNANGGGAILERSMVDISTYTGGLTFSSSPSGVTELRFNYSASDGDSDWEPDAFAGAALPDLSNFFPGFAETDDSQISYFLTSAFAPTYRVGARGAGNQGQWNVVASHSQVLGAHSLKFGVDYRKMTSEYNPQNYQQSIFFSSIDGIVAGETAAFAGVIQAFRGDQFPRFTNLSIFAQDAWRLGGRTTVTYGLRWEFNPPPTEKNDNGPLPVRSLDDPANLAVGARGDDIWATRYTDFAPRVGFSHLLRQSNRYSTVLRGGVGLFYAIQSGQVGRAYRAFAFPFVATKYVFGVTPFPLPDEAAAAPPFSDAPPYQNMTAFDPELKSPYSTHWNATIEQSLGAAQTLSVGYVASVGRRLYRMDQLGDQNEDFPDFRVIRNLDTSDHHSLQVQFKRRLGGVAQGLASYTWSHSIDTASSDFVGSLPRVVTTPENDRGSSDFDIRHALTAAATMALPSPEGGALRTILGDWSLNPIVKAYSPTPFNPNQASGEAFGNALRPNLVVGADPVIEDSSLPGGKRFNPEAFQASTTEHGSLGRNSFRGFFLWQADLGLHKHFKITESVSVRIGGEFFNLFNTPNFAPPVNNLANAQFGRSTQMLNRFIGGLNPLYQIGGPRSVQLGLRLEF